MYAFPALSVAEAAEQQASGTAQGDANGSMQDEHAVVSADKALAMPTSSASAMEVEENNQQIAVESEAPAIAAQIGGFHLSGDGNRSTTCAEEKERADAASDRAADG
mmetsp:Transcript_83094/g.134711  ORF Transcript_83094/g.134711 Transcript_83094/m.134711 type:complete len:107 (+) Transcript_83094:592-912(+)